jgi:hypothetical protein
MQCIFTLFEVHFAYVRLTVTICMHTTTVLVLIALTADGQSSAMGSQHQAQLRLSSPFTRPCPFIILLLLSMLNQSTEDIPI